MRTSFSRLDMGAMSELLKETINIGTFIENHRVRARNNTCRATIYKGTHHFCTQQYSPEYYVCKYTKRRPVSVSPGSNIGVHMFNPSPRTHGSSEALHHVRHSFIIPEISKGRPSDDVQGYIVASSLIARRR